ncbi:MAG TPA: SpoIIE family protein phosphatase, partial [Chitinophagales bacterium]|nr:SpoIIE family protein phosphatase [Chitinophagales bacterium]
MLGIFEELPKMEFGKINIQPDTTIVSFTDGISELEDEKGLQFGVDRLIEFSKQNHRLSPEIFNKMLYDYI